VALQRQGRCSGWSFGSYHFAEERTGTESQGPPAETSAARLSLPRERTLSMWLVRCGSCPPQSLAVKWSHPDACTARSWFRLGDTTPSTIKWRSAHPPASARWRGQLLEARNARPGRGKTRARPRLTPGGGIASVLRSPPARGRRLCGISLPGAEKFPACAAVGMAIRGLGLTFDGIKSAVVSLGLRSGEESYGTPA
jgi:hypothetical protein